MERDLRAKQAALNAQKEADEAAASKHLGGRLLSFMVKATDNETPIDYSCSGLILGAARTQILAKIVAYNTSLKSLHLARKGIADKEGQDLARALFSNKTLRKMELEGNQLSFMTARVFALALQKNKTLQFLDLESNDLSHEGQKKEGIEAMIRALETNTTLLSLNVANNGLEAEIGRQFRDMLKVNKTLIDFEFSSNFFNIEDVSFKSLLFGPG